MRIHLATIIAGSVLLALGAAMLLDSTGTVAIPAKRLFGPLFLIALGAAITLNKGAEVSDPERRNRSTGGLWLIGIGAWMMVSQARLFGLTYATSWPLFMIVMGLMIVLRGIR